MPHAQLSRRQAFQPSCPRGGTFYACQGGTNFVGCCTSEACSDGCSAGNLKPASFEPKHQGKFADQECPRGSQWYTCAATSPPFMGCCKSDPCKSNGCPVSDLSAGFLSSNPAVAADFLPADSKASSTQSKGEPMKTSSSSAEPSSSISSIKSTSSLSPASETSSAAPRPVHTQPTVAGSSAKHSNTRAIAGGSAGGAVAAMLLLALLLFILRRKANRSREHMSFSRAVNWGSGKEMVNSAGQGMQSDYKTPEPFNTPELMSTPAPTYTSSRPASELDASPQPSQQTPSPQLPQYQRSPPESPRPPAPLPETPKSFNRFRTWGTWSDGGAYRQ